MSIVPLVRPLEPCEGTPASSRLAHEVFALASRLIEGFAREARVRRDMKRLAEFDDDMLRDIGLTRSDIESAVRHGRDHR
jgi:uncharacterized protein YjiS (DUF1127 family)